MCPPAEASLMAFCIKEKAAALYTASSRNRIYELCICLHIVGVLELKDRSK